MKKPYNKKAFLLPNSPRSMACFHAKVMDDNIMKLTIHDCKGSIQLHNDLNDPEQAAEAVQKLKTLAIGIMDLQTYITQNFTTKKSNHF